MKEMGLEFWKWAAAGALMALITCMMVLGIGAKRGTWLYRLRLSMWMIVMGLGGAAGCSETTLSGRPDGGDVGGTDPVVNDPSPTECYVAPWDPGPEPAPDTNTDPDAEPDFSCVECYQAPWDPEPDAPSDPDVEEEDVEEDG
jgi:hypothetical protein